MFFDMRCNFFDKVRGLVVKRTILASLAKIWNCRRICYGEGRTGCPPLCHSRKNGYLSGKELSMLQIGDKMPAFEVLDQDGNTVTSQDLVKTGKKTIIYFYPKDNTSGCTAEACSFRDNYAALTAQGYNVVGVSKDSVKSHTGFRAKHGLPFRLLSDTSTEMLQAFGAWGEKKMYGKTVLGTLRRTFIFNEAGTLERIIEKVDTKNAAAQILEP